MNKNGYNLALCGYGAIGKGVVKIVNSLPSSLNIKMTKVLDKEEKREELGELFVPSYLDITLDPTIDVVFEAMGGDAFAYTCIKSALENGKSVITSNKETVSKHLDEYLSLAKKNNCYFLFEASVGGGIPLIYTLLEICDYDHINRIQGILNGTTNYILTRVIYDNLSFEDALKEAQKKGYAEANPDADINGADLARKGAILASLAFNKIIDVNEVKTYGLQYLNQKVIDEIQKMNKVLKYVVDAKRVGEDISLSIMPTLINKEHAFESIKYETNGVVLSCEFNDDVVLIGKGAGQLPTASSMIQDLFRVIKGNGEIERKNVSKATLLPPPENNYLVLDKNGDVFIKYLNSFELDDYPFIARII